MTYRIVYDNETGQIAMNRNLSDAQVQEIISKNPKWSYIDGAVDSVSERVVNLQTLKIERRQRRIPSVANLIRERRKLLLQACDWTDTLSAKTRLGDDLYNQWQTYRQALRDLPDEQGGVNSIDDVAWPTPPQ
jgi:hypothetical protein